MVRQWQEMFYKKEYSASQLYQHKRTAIERIKCNEPIYLPDFIKMAEAHGANGIRIKEKKEVQPALKEALSTKGPFVVECIVKQEENVYPMVPPGASLTEMIHSMA